MHAKFIYSCIQTCNAHPIPSMGTDSIYHIEREQNIANANNIVSLMKYMTKLYTLTNYVARHIALIMGCF